MALTKEQPHKRRAPCALGQRTEGSQAGALPVYRRQPFAAFCSASVSLNVTATCVYAWILLVPSVAATKRHLRTASVAAWSRRGKPLLWVTWTLDARPLVSTSTFSRTVPCSPARREAGGYVGSTRFAVLRSCAGAPSSCEPLIAFADAGTGTSLGGVTASSN